MSRSAKIRRFFGEARFDFALNIGECEELQEEFDCGLVPLQRRCAEVGVREIRTVLRLGLVGGGLDKERAAMLIDRHVCPGDLATGSILAVELINAAIVAPEDEPLGEPKGKRTGGRRSPKESSASPTTTAPAPRSGFRRGKSASVPSGS